MKLVSKASEIGEKNKWNWWGKQVKLVSKASEIGEQSKWNWWSKHVKLVKWISVCGWLITARWFIRLRALNSPTSIKWTQKRELIPKRGATSQISQILAWVLTQVCVCVCARERASDFGWIGRPVDEKSVSIIYGFKSWLSRDLMSGVLRNQNNRNELAKIKILISWSILKCLIKKDH